MMDTVRRITTDWRCTKISPTATIQDAAQNLNDSTLKISLVVDESDRLLGTLTDGDIRRGLLRGMTLSSPIGDIIRRNPLVVPAGLSSVLICQMMAINKIQQIPEVDEENRVLALHTWNDFDAPKTHDHLMVIMSGGKGTRLRPHTEDCPKPMLEVRGKPMLAHIIERARAEGFVRFVLAIHYFGHIIEDYFQDGTSFGVNIEYLREDAPLGTVGALSLMRSLPDKPFVVTNGDVITDIKYLDLLDFHSRQGADATMAVRLHELQLPFGVVQMKGLEIIGFEEKPIVRSHINAGIYALSPAALRYLTQNQECDMPALFLRLQEADKRVIVYPMHESWLDVGRPSDLDHAQHVKDNKNNT